MALKTTRFDIQDHLTTPGERAAYLAAVFEDGDEEFIKLAINDVARSVGMTNVAREAGVTREAFYRSLSKGGNPRLSTLMGTLKALGVKLSAVSAENQV